MKLLVILFTTIWICSGCNPARRINMKNNTGEKATITWKLLEDSMTVSPLFLSSDKEVAFELGGEGPSKNIVLSCGIGTWKPKDVKDLTDDLEWLELKWSTGEIHIETGDSILKYLMPRRKGLGKNQIEIRITN